MPLSTIMPLSSGDIFAGFRIVRQLGSGGMGEVYLAQHPRLPRHDALKILGTDVSVDEEYRQRFIREADLAATLWHPNIVNDRGEFSGQLWISMDYVEGTDAARLMQDRYPAGMPADEVAAIVAAIASALDYAHQRGLLHRDVKPGNILLANPENGEQRILLSDFGIARNIGDVSGLTATNMTMGTLPYAAPEQLMDEPMDGRADQYALAATAYHLLTGSPMFPQSNPAVVISRHLNAPPPTLANTRPELAALDPVLAAALAKDPADRFARCTDFARSFAEAAQPADRGAAWAPTMRSPVASRPPASTAVPPVQADTDGQKRRWRPRMIVLGAAIAVVVLVAVGLIGYTNQPKHNTASTPSPPAAVLDGTYRVVYDFTKGTTNGAPNPAKSNTDNIHWWAFRSLCTSTGCVATGTQLDTNNPKIGLNPAVTSVLHFADGRWQETPNRSQVDYDRCLGVDGKVIAGADTVMRAKSLEPQPDGTMRGVVTGIVLTNACSYQGVVIQVPVVATRTGDLPTGVIVADPVGLTASPSTNTPAPPAAGPVLDGAFRFDHDDTGQTLNGTPVTSDTKKETHWGAFRSLCTPTRCVATGAALADNNQQIPTGAATVFQFTDGRWQGTPHLQLPAPCKTGNGTANVTQSESLQPQPDGTLHGFNTITVLTNECGGQGDVYKTPVVATRIGDVPPAVVLADPALFAS
jgi:serine/threonine protein kinase, bacterial